MQKPKKEKRKNEDDNLLEVQYAGWPSPAVLNMRCFCVR